MEEIGLESSLLDALIREERTVELRLARDRYKKMNVGDKLAIRRDVWKRDKIVESVPEVAYVEIIGIMPFESISELFEFIDFRRVMPTARNLKKAMKICRQFYSEQEEKSSGVLALEINLLAVNKR